MNCVTAVSKFYKNRTRFKQSKKVAENSASI